jgi:hypothetical protein
MGTCVLVSEQAFSKAIAYPMLVKSVLPYAINAVEILSS